MQSSTKLRNTLVYSVLFLLLFWFSRLIAIERFPLFIDETIHINLSEQGYQTSPLIYAELGRVFMGWLVVLETAPGELLTIISQSDDRTGLAIYDLGG